MQDFIYKFLNKTFPKYLIAGFLSFVVDYGSLYLLSLIGVKLVIGNILSVLLSIIFNFLIQNYWTFKAGSNNKIKKSIKYISLTAFDYIFNITAFYLLFEHLELENFLEGTFLSEFPDGLVTKILITGSLACWNYIVFKYWVFKKNEY